MIHDVIRAVTDELIEEYGSAYEINNGGCEEWADLVFERLEGKKCRVEVWATPYCFASTNHSFVRINGKFYDAECLDGVDDHNDLPIFRKLIRKGEGRQPVWCENANHDATESVRDVDDELRKLIREEQIASGVEPSRALSLKGK